MTFSRLGAASIIILLLTVTAGCVTTAQLDSVRQTAEQAAAKAEDANRTAQQALGMVQQAKDDASAAKAAAEEAKQAASANSEKIDRMFKQAVKK